MLQASIQKNDKKASWLIWIFSFAVFALVVATGSIKLKVDIGFDVNIFALFNAVVNSLVALLLVAALVAVKQGKFVLHKRIMMAALVFSLLFLLSYVAHKLLAGEARFGDSNHDGIVTDAEKAAVGSLRLVYFIILITHIILAAVILPFILFTAYRGLTADFAAHKKIARYTWPLWFYVAATGPIVYCMISPYYR